MQLPGKSPLPVPGRMPGPEQTRRLALGGSEGAVQRSREFSREALRSWHWLPAADDEQQAVTEDVLLMVSELVTNACLYAPGGPRELRLSWNGHRLRVEVADASPVPPRLRPHADPGRPGGHGLRVVDRLARAWGSLPEGEGKLVWLEVPSPLDHRGRLR
ncbi:ATP-binding protein [Streptomyces kaniharaensis]|uniref:ATP-binding protein n=1 Tax=Streptomyces kaniharaensis TaxID=212423 RepID=A0A6N7L2E7_9ACTN|nr:ATP-binding protein [Streptomyces kaniharaensis]MQS16859.1 ATP-binding protein [Streptomyces kaniharaensis]